MRWIPLLIVLLISMMLVGCNSPGSTQVAQDPATADTPFSTIPLPDLSRQVSSVDGFACTGSEYQDLWGHSNVAVVDTSLEYTPDWPAQGHSGVACAIYHFEFAAEVLRDEINITWSEHGDFSDLWLGLEDFNENRWDFYPGNDGTIALPLTDHLFSDHRVFIVIAITGNDTWILDGIELGSTPAVIAVEPQVIIPGADTQLVPEFIGKADTWSWTVDAAGTLDDSTTEQPTLTATAIDDIYDCTVTATNSFGTGPAFEFQLSVGPPVITGVSPNGITDTSSLNWFIPTYQGQVDTWSWDLTDLGVVISDDAIQGGVSEPYNLGIHECSVTALNSYGSDTFNFKVAVWHEEEIANSLGDYNGYTDIVFDGEDVPHISYHSSIPEALCYATKLEDTWQLTTIDEGVNIGEYTSIDVDSNGYPRIANRADAGAIQYSVYDGSDWQVSVLPGATTDRPDIELDEWDIPWIAFADQTNGSHKTHLFSYVDNSWSDEVCQSGLAYNARIRFDPAGRPVLGVLNADKYIVLQQNAGEWDALPPVYSLMLDAFSLEVDNEGNPHLLYMDTYDFDLGHRKVMYAAWNGNDWETEILRDGSSVLTAYTLSNCLQVDSMGLMHAIYGTYTGSTGRELWYARRTGTEWEHFRVSDTYQCSYYPSIALDSNDQPHIVHTTGPVEQLLINSLVE